MTTSDLGPREPNSAAYRRAVRAIRYMQANDCDFLTVANVSAYGHVSADVARKALRDVMGEEWCATSGWDDVR